MSLCDRCTDPGHCCRNIRLYSRGWSEPGPTALHALVWLAQQYSDDNVIGLPFLPIERRPHYDPRAAVCPVNDQWVYTCVNLTEDGRCGDYDHRPWLCRVFTPGIDDALCVMRNGARCPTPVLAAADGEIPEASTWRSMLFNDAHPPAARKACDLVDLDVPRGTTTADAA